MRSIRERILKVADRVGADGDVASCSEVDPGEDTERGADKLPPCLGEKVAVRSIRERILKVQF